MSEIPKCFKCALPITESYLTTIKEKQFHNQCAVCVYCSKELADVCFVNEDGGILCRVDYYKHFSQKCASCNQPVISHELIMKAKLTDKNSLVYHAACFCCSVCFRRLVQGDQYILHPKEKKLLCKSDFYEYIKNSKSDETSSLTNSDICQDNISQNGKKGRTILTDQQKNVFLKVFQSHPRPNKQVRDMLASETGVPQRVIQVWFQNHRAKEKKLTDNDKELNEDYTHSSKSYEKTTPISSPNPGYTQNLQDPHRSSYNTNPLSPNQSLSNLFNR